MNQVLLVGRLCKDPEIIITDQEHKRSVITLAVSRSYKNSEGIYEADFIRCVLWNNVALNTFSYCHTGDVLGVKGRLQTRSYEENDEKKYIMEVIAEKITFISSNKGSTKNESVQEQENLKNEEKK